jgi:uncharacterized OB-fold protein
MAEQNTAAQANPEAAPYWEAARAHKLLVKHCNACGENHYYPRALCPFCFSDQTEWRESKGEGTVYSFTIVRRAAPPYALAYITLDEGVTMLSHIVGSDFDRIRIGQRVGVVFDPGSEGQPIPKFSIRET